MWKPGAPKPISKNDHNSMDMTAESSSAAIAPSTRSNHSSTSDKSASDQQKQAMKRKQLSNSTMGMRFMQRSKAYATAAAAVLNKIVTNKQDDDHDDEIMHDVSSTAPQQSQEQQASPHQEKAETEQSTPGNDLLPPSSSSSRLPSFTVATASEMYGVKADMVGRRSFGGFHKGVEDAYQSSWQAWKTGQTIGTNKDGQALSDEELLRLYQELVNNRGEKGCVDNDDYTKTCGKAEDKSEPIGNLKKQPKRNGQRGAKRKR